MTGLRVEGYKSVSEGLLKSLKTWAIPAPDEAMVQLRHLGIKGWSTRNSFDSVALTNTGITPVLDEGGGVKNSLPEIDVEALSKTAQNFGRSREMLLSSKSKLFLSGLTNSSVMG